MIFVIDAGHGGSASGATGRMSIYSKPEETVYEKNLTKDFADAAKSYFEIMLEATVYMARENDDYVTLTDRARVAHDHNADALISIHFNSTSSSTVKGGETFYAQTRSQDKNFAEAIQFQLVDWYGRYDRGTKNDTQSGAGELTVLRAFQDDDRPRALVEVEFISNTTEMNKIGEDYYESTLDFATAMVFAMRDYYGLNVALTKETRPQLPELKAKIESRVTPQD